MQHPSSSENSAASARSGSSMLHLLRWINHYGTRSQENLFAVRTVSGDVALPEEKNVWAEGWTESPETPGSAETPEKSPLSDEIRSDISPVAFSASTLDTLPLPQDAPAVLAKVRKEPAPFDDSEDDTSIQASQNIAGKALRRTTTWYKRSTLMFFRSSFGPAESPAQRMATLFAPLGAKTATLDYDSSAFIPREQPRHVWTPLESLPDPVPDPVLPFSRRRRNLWESIKRKIRTRFVPDSP